METSFLFGSRCEWLGEITTASGKLVQFILTADGEREMGAYVEEWQTRGVPIKREVSTQTAKQQELVFFIERIQGRDAHFLQAVQGWMEARGYALLSITPLMSEIWPVISNLPLEPREQFTFLVLLRSTTIKEGQAWKEVLNEAEQAVAKEDKLSLDGLSRLRTQSSHGLANALKKKTRD